MSVKSFRILNSDSVFGDLFLYFDFSGIIGWFPGNYSRTCIRGHMTTTFDDSDEFRNVWSLHGMGGLLPHRDSSIKERI